MLSLFVILNSFTHTLLQKDSKMNLRNNIMIIQGVSKRALQLWKRREIYAEDIHNVFNCQNVAKHTEFYLG